MDTANAGFNGVEYVGNGQIVVVMRMIIEICIGVGFNYFPAIIVGFIGIENSQCVGQHDAVHIFFFQVRNHKVDVLPGTPHAVGPVFQVYVHLYPHFGGVGNHFFDVVQVLLRCFSKLFLHMFSRTFAQQVDHFTPCIGNPLQGDVIIHKPEDFHFFKVSFFFCPAQNPLSTFKFAI